MKSVTKKFALAALCTTALFAASQSANAAAFFSIDNSVTFNSFTYGTTPPDNNVVNDPSAGLSDGTTPTTWHASGGAGSASVSITGLPANQSFRRPIYLPRLRIGRRYQIYGPRPHVVPCGIL